MRIVTPRRLREYGQKHPDAQTWLHDWTSRVAKSHWQSLIEVRRQYPHADAVIVASGRTVTVFNVRGNDYRLVVAIKYDWQMVYILRFLTHAQYSKDRWKGDL